MHIQEFIDTHVPALEADEARHNLMLALLALAARDARVQLSTWTLAGPGACAIKSPDRPIILGDVREAECHALAETTRELAIEGVVGPDPAPLWFVQRAEQLGLSFADPIPQRIHALRDKPVYPGAPGQARQVLAEDAPLFADWLMAFAREAVPHDPEPSREDLAKVAGEGRHMFWVVDGRPVAMAGIARRLRTAGAISAVYTPLDQRGRGYAGSVTAAVADRLFAEGKTMACLYTDLRNPASNRCYAKIGFKPVCDSSLYPPQPRRA